MIRHFIRISIDHSKLLKHADHNASTRLGTSSQQPMKPVSFLIWFRSNILVGISVYLDSLCLWPLIKPEPCLTFRELNSWLKTGYQSNLLNWRKNPTELEFQSDFWKSLKIPAFHCRLLLQWVKRSIFAQPQGCYGVLASSLHPLCTSSISLCPPCFVGPTALA